jgi:hypothetical protein
MLCCCSADVYVCLLLLLPPPPCHVLHAPAQVVHTRYRPARLSTAWPKAAWFMSGHGRWGLKEASDSPLKVRVLGLSVSGHGLGFRDFRFRV